MWGNPRHTPVRCARTGRWRRAGRRALVGGTGRRGPRGRRWSRRWCWFRRPRTTRRRRRRAPPTPGPLHARVRARGGARAQAARAPISGSLLLSLAFDTERRRSEPHVSAWKTWYPFRWPCASDGQGRGGRRRRAHRPLLERGQALHGRLLALVVRRRRRRIVAASLHHAWQLGTRRALCKMSCARVQAEGQPHCSPSGISGSPRRGRRSRARPRARPSTAITSAGWGGGGRAWWPLAHSLARAKCPRRSRPVAPVLARARVRA